jgi:hypothetical protein
MTTSHRRPVASAGAGDIPRGPTIGLSVKSGLWYGGEIALSELQDGAEHDLELHPIMNELSPARGLC